MREAIAAIVLAAVCTLCHAEEGYVTPNGFMSGNDFQTFSPTGQKSYIDGIIDGFYYAPMIAQSNNTHASEIQRCLLAMHATDTQLVAIVNKYMADNPQLWGQKMNFITMAALFRACKQVGSPIFN
jgi:hypothetical protein